MTRQLISVATLSIFTILAASGCEDKSTPTAADWPAAPEGTSGSAPAPTAPAGTAPAAPRSDTGGGVDLAGLIWNIPEGWESVGASGMRLAEYSVSLDGEMASIRFFSTQGSAQMNIDRWKGQVKDPTDGPATKTITAGPLVAHIVAMTGTYSGMGPGGAATPPASGTRMLGAYVEGGPRPVQIVVTGPEKVVRSVEPAWEKMLSEVRLAGH